MPLGSGNYQQNQTDRFFELSLDLMCILGFDGYLKRTNPAWTQILGWTEAELLSQPIIDLIHPADRPNFFNVLEIARSQATPGPTEFRYRHRDGSYRWIRYSVFPQLDQQVFLAIGHDITVQKRQNEFDRGQTKVLEMVAMGKPLHQTLTALLMLLESHVPQLHCCVMLLDEDQQHLNSIAAPTLPEGFQALLQRVPIGQIGSCSVAARTGKTVIVEDIENDPIWAGIQHLPLQYGLRACWATPIHDPTNKLLGTFAGYYTDRRRPDPDYQQLVELSVQLAAVAISRDLTERNLRRSEDVFATIFHNAPVAMVIRDLETNRYVDINDYALKVSEYSRHEILNQTAQDIGWIREEARQRMMDELTRIGSLNNLEVVLHSKSGKMIHSLISGKQIMLYNRLCLITVATDITDHKRIENTLRDRENFLDRIINNIGDPFFVKDDQLRFVLVNDSFCALFGLVREDIIGQILAEQTPKDQREQFWRDDRRVLETGEDVVCEEKISIRNLPTRTIATRKTRYVDSAGNCYVVGLTRDITASVAAQEKLKHSEASLAAAQSLARLGSWEFHLQNQTGTWSAEMFRIFSRDPAAGAPSLAEFINMIHSDDRERLRSTIHNVIENRGDFTQQVRTTGLSNGVQWIECRASIKCEAGTPLWLVGTTQDISDRKYLEEQLLHAQKLEAVGTLAGGIAHDFNNILTAIKGYTQLAREDVADKQTTSEYLDAAIKSANRGAELVKQITTFSRHHDIQRKPISLQQVVPDALMMLRAIIPSTVEIRSSLQPDASPILGDVTQIHQIVLNLCTNAWHAMNAGAGVVEICVDQVQVDAAFAAAHTELKPGSHIRLTISDSGCGMDAATLSRIFDPFFTTKSSGEGTGLGLSVVHGIVISHEGCIVVDSKPQHGTRFELYFPAIESSKNALADSTGTYKVVHSEPSRGRVLLVDDEPALVELGVLMLKRMGYLVKGFASSDEALAAVRNAPHEFDIVVSDLSMPGMSGLEVIEEIRRVRPDIPVIVMSGYVDAHMQSRIEATGIQKLMLKPFTFDDIGMAVRQIINADGNSAST